jgi:hypothetical protein
MSEVSFELELAKKRVERFKDVSDELMRDHLDAMQCLDCQDALEKGVHAFEAIRRADDVLREAAGEGIPVSEQLIAFVESLYELWLTPCELVEQWIRELEARGYRPDNLDKFREASRQVRRSLAVIASLKAIDSIHTQGF